MFSSLSALCSSANSNSSSMSSSAIEILGTIQNQNFEEKIPLTSKEEVEEKLASTLIQLQQNRIKRLDLTSASLGHFYDLAHTLRGHKNAICSLVTLKNSGIIASGSGKPENAIKLWSLSSHACLATLQGHTSSIWALAVLPNNLLASGSDDSTIKLWDLASHSCLATLQGHISSVNALAALPNNLLASGSDDSTIKLWDLASNSCLFTLQGHTSSINALAVLPNDLLASGSDDATIKLWDFISHSCLFTLQEHIYPVNALTVLPNGQLASGSYDHTIKLWDLASLSCLSTLQGHVSLVFALAALPNGLLVSGSWDTTIKLWDLASNSCLSTLQGHVNDAVALAVLPNGQLASVSGDCTIKLWGFRTLSATQLSSILSALRNNTSVTDLDLSGNRDILDVLIGPLTSIFASDVSSGSKPNSSLKTIDLRRTGVSKKGIKRLEKAIQQQRLSIEVLADCPIEWEMIYFLIIFCRATRNSPFTDSGLDLAKSGEIGPFLGTPSCFFARLHKNPSSPTEIALSANSPS